jgi:hypothetical protein
MDFPKVFVGHNTNVHHKGLEARKCRMKTSRFVAALLPVAFLFVFECANDYNPFENYNNANAQILASATSKGISSGATLFIFSTETLAVYTTVREKIDSFRVTAPRNRYFTNTVVKPPFSKDNYLFLLSFFDTGWTWVNVTTYRSNNTIDSLPAPIALYVKSPLRQDSITKVLGAPCTLWTAPVGDMDVLYEWEFGKDTVLGITSNSVPNPYPMLPNIGKSVGKRDTGYLWVTDLKEQVRSPMTSFSYLFYEPVPPRIKCQNAGISNDTIITGDDTLLLLFKVIDSSGQGLSSVTLQGDTLRTNDSITFYKTITGMSQYKFPDPAKAEIVTAVNRLGQATTDTFYVRYIQGGSHGARVIFKLVNPETTFLTTLLDTLLYIMDVENYTQGQITVGTTIQRPGVSTPVAVGSDKVFSDSVHRCVWVVPLGHAAVPSTNVFDTIRTSASTTFSMPGMPVETTIVVQRSTPLVDTPQILEILVNGKPYDASKTYDTTSATIAILVVDNGSGIKAVTMLDSIAGGVGVVNKGTLVPMTNQGLGWWTSTAVLFNVRLKLNLVVTATNNILRETRRILVITRTPRIVPAQ